MTDYPTGSPAAGWYTDPADASQQRWWGGTQWTHDTRPLPAPVAAPVAVAAPALADVSGGGINPFAALDAQQAPQTSFGSDRPTFNRGAHDFSDFNSLGTSGFGAPEQRYDVSASWYDQDRRSVSSLPPTNRTATAGLVLSLIGLNVAGIVFSVIGLRKAREFERDGDLPVGRKRSLWGLVLGIISAVLTTALIVLWFTAYATVLAWIQQQPDVVPDSGVIVDDGGSSSVIIDDGSYDRATYEQEIHDDYVWEEEGTPLSVTCPDVASTAPGSTITCTVVLPDRTDTWTAEYYEDGAYSVSTFSIQ